MTRQKNWQSLQTFSRWKCVLAHWRWWETRLKKWLCWVRRAGRGGAGREVKIQIFHFHMLVIYWDFIKIIFLCQWIWGINMFYLCDTQCQMRGVTVHSVKHCYHLYFSPLYSFDDHNTCHHRNGRDSLFWLNCSVMATTGQQIGQNKLDISFHFYLFFKVGRFNTLSLIKLGTNLIKIM